MTTITREQFGPVWRKMTDQQRRTALLAASSRPKKIDASPLALAQRLDPMIVSTPALNLLDSYMIQVRDAVDVMYQRRRRYAQLVRQGVPDAIAIEQTEIEIPNKGVNRLIVSVPPQEGKSTLISQYNIEWELQQFAAMRFALVSYGDSNAGRISYLIRADIETFNGREKDSADLGLRLAADEKAKSRWLLTTGGGVYAIGIGGGLSGRPVDYMIIDDPVKDHRDADSHLKSQNAWDWWLSVGQRRLAPGAPVVVVTTRWDEDDLPGRLMQKQRDDEKAGIEQTDKWIVINIPAEADHDPKKGESDVLGRKPGEFMISARGRSRNDWLLIKNSTSTSPRFWNALYQGRPSPATGTTFQREWFRYYDTMLWQQQPDQSFRVPGYELWQSWDFTFRDTSGTDFVVGQVWASKGPNVYLITQIRARLSFTASLDAMRRLNRLFPQSRGKLVEGKANGDAIVDVLKKELSGIIVVNPTKSKLIRAEAVSPFVRAGNVWLPNSDVALAHPDLAFSVPDYVAEFLAFPTGAHDDQVDATTQFLREKFLKGGDGTFVSPKGRIATGTLTSSQQKPLSPVQARLARQARGK
jgi:predicted phage terminase large subunit-like protein